jgi:hypothetical protein
MGIESKIEDPVLVEKCYTLAKNQTDELLAYLNGILEQYKMDLKTPLTIKNTKGEKVIITTAEFCESLAKTLSEDFTREMIIHYMGQ